jgi:nucleotide-binding universal stress UspA family protein
VRGPIVVGTDGSETAKKAIRQTAELAARVGAPVHVVLATYRADGGAQGDGPVKKALADVAATFGAQGVAYETHVRTGEPADAIIEVAEEQEAGLIVVGNKGMGGSRRYLLGDVPNKVSHHAPCNVMILRTTETSERGTVILAGLAFGSLAAVGAGEMIRLWRRGSRDAGRESMSVAKAGYRASSSRERALLNVLAAFVVTSAITRRSTWVLRHRGHFGPIKEIVRGPRHIHHFVPGIILAFVCGGAALVTDDGRLQERLSVPFGIGVALTLDEWALLLELNDVYWSDEGIVSIQVTLGTTALLAALTLGIRFLARGERRVAASRRWLRA